MTARRPFFMVGWVGATRSVEPGRPFFLEFFSLCQAGRQASAKKVYQLPIYAQRV